MSTISFTVRNTSMTSEAFAEFCDEVQARLEELTPVDTGYCQDSWSQNWSPASCTFINDADYSSFLDDGWSKQAPNGMTAVVLDELDSIADNYR